MELGAFSVSLSVRDIAVSMQFYSNLGFAQIGGVEAEGWVIMRNGTTTIGLFQGMFEDNMLTFNPGWAQDTTPLETFDDIRDIQAQLNSKGITPAAGTDPEGTAPAHLMLEDPDGNKILLDQHVPQP